MKKHRVTGSDQRRYRCLRIKSTGILQFMVKVFRGYTEYAGVIPGFCRVTKGL